MKKTKVLVVLGTMYDGGVAQTALRFQQGMDKEKFDFTFLVRLYPGGKLEKVAEENGIRVIHQPQDAKKLTKAIRYYKELFRKEKFDVIHCNSTFYTAVLLKCASDCGIKKRIAHAHLTRKIERKSIKKVINSIYETVMRKAICHYATDMLACSQGTGEALYGKKKFEKRGRLLNNPIDYEKFIFSEEIRVATRKKLGVEGDTVVWGHVGRLVHIKNQEFIIELLAQYKETNKNVTLLLVGEGPDKELLKKKADELKCKENVLFLGNRDDVNEIMMALDILIFPSFAEGFPLALIEAQTTKLPCLVADTVSRTVKINGNVDFMPLETEKENWLRKVDELLEYDRDKIDISNIKQQFGIKEVGSELEKIYLNI